MIVACWKVINEINYLPYSLKAVYDYVDKLVIVEGCDLFMRKWIQADRLSPEGLSSDGTTEAIKSFPDPDGKIAHIPLGFVQGDELIFWNKLVDACNVEDFCWMIDADEIYMERDIKQLVEWMRSDKYWAIEFPMINFWHDFHHTINGGDWNPIHGRIFKILEEGMHFSDYSNFARLKKGRQLLSMPEMRHKKHRTAFPIYHYSYVRPPQKILEKQLWQGGMYLQWDTSEKWQRERERFKHPADYICRNFSWFNCIYDQVTGVWVESYQGEHPEVMRNHPYSELRWNEKPLKVRWQELMNPGRW